MTVVAHNPYKHPWWEEAFAAGVPPRPTARGVSGEDTFDVVVVGSGMAGYVTSIVIAEAGDSVLMVEARSEGGGTTYKSGAGMWVPDNSLMLARGRGPNRDWALNHMAKTGFASVYDPNAECLGLQQRDYDLIVTYYENAAGAVDALAALGLRIMEFPSFTGDYEAMVEYHNDIEHGYGSHLCPQQDGGEWGSGNHLVERLDAMAAARGVELRTEHRVSDVLQGPDGEVTGVIAGTPNGEVSLYARKGVVFCSGGYPHNRELTLEHFPGGLYGSCAVPTARGDFIGIATRLGAELGNMGEGWGTQHPLDMMLRDSEVDNHIGAWPGDSSFMVDASGKRVINEKTTYHERSKVHFRRDPDGSLPNHLLFQIYDSFNVKDDMPMVTKWPDPDPSNHWVISGDTLDELADNIAARLAEVADKTGGFALQPGFKAGLKETFDRFNAFAAAGVDEDFHRGETDYERDWTGRWHIENDKNPTLWPLDDGPYFCVILAGSVLDTNGGPRASAQGEILRADGSAIPGLYGAGNCVSSVAGGGYFSGGSTLGPAATFAYLAGRHLAQQPARDLTSVG